MAPSSISKLAIVYFISFLMSTTSASTTRSLDRRQDSCPVNFTRCADMKLPSNFCCPSDSTCLSLDNSSTALCCPKGADCSRIQPVSCNLNFQDASSKPEAAVKTTRLQDKLESCGTSCCPFGYTCQGNTICALIEPTASPTSSSASKTASASATPTSTVPAIASNQAPICSRFPGGAVAVGFFPGLFVGAILALIGVILLGRQHGTRPGSKGSFGGGSSHKYSNSLKRGRAADGTIIGISGPIPMNEGGARTDFLRRPNTLLRQGTNRAKSWFNPRQSPDAEKATSPLNPVNHWKMPTPPYPNNIPTNTNAINLPFTPPSQIRGGPHTMSTIAREPSSESIKIYNSPPSMISAPGKSGFSPNEPTTFKQSVLSKLSPKLSSRFSPFKGTELRNKSPNQQSLYPNHPAFQQPSAPSPIPSPPPAALAPAPLSTRSHQNPYSFDDADDNSSNNPSPPPTTQHTSLAPLPNTSYQTPSQPHSNSYPAYTTPHIPGPPTNSNLNPNPDTLAPFAPHARDQSTLRPPESRPLTHMTTFTEVLRDAGLESRDDQGDRPDVPELPRGVVMGAGKWGNVVDKKVKRDASRAGRRRKREERRERDATASSSRSRKGRA